MGLAASQARLLFITSRQNDVSAKMQRISNQTMILARDEEEISDKYNRMLNATTKQLISGVDLSYDSVMGSDAINNKGSISIITNADGKVALSSADIKKYGLSNNGNPGDLVMSLDKFIQNAEPNNYTSIIGAKGTVQSKGTDTSILDSSDKSKISSFMNQWGEYPSNTQVMSVSKLLETMGTCNISQYGATSSFANNFTGQNFTNILNGDMSWRIADDGERSGANWNIDNAKTNFNATAQMFKDKILEAMGLKAGSTVDSKLNEFIAKKMDELSNRTTDGDITAKGSISSRGDNLDYADLRVSRTLQEMVRIALQAVVSDSDSGSFDTRGEIKSNKDKMFTIITNSKGYSVDEWEKELKSLFTDANKQKAAIEFCKPSASQDDDTPATNGEKYACYEAIYNALKSKGWAVEDDVSSIGAKLQNPSSGYQIDGTTLSNSELYEEVADPEATAKAEAYWKTETAKLSRKEKQLDRELTKLQTEYSALTTDYESVKSIIQQNVTKSFTYCNNG